MVISYSFLEEVGFAFQRDHVHPIERIGGVVDLGGSQCEDQSIGDVLDVLVHQLRVYSDQFGRKGAGDELLLDLHSTADDFMDSLLFQFRLHHVVKVAGEVGVEPLISGNELV